MKKNEQKKKERYCEPAAEFIEIQMSSVLTMSNEDPFDQDPD